MPDLKEELADWIDSETLAEGILDGLEEQGVSLTLENAQTLWLDILQNELPEAIRSSVKARFDVV